MLERAKEKLKLEMEQNKANGYVQFIGQSLIDYLRDDPAAAEAILTEGKTVVKSLGALESEARKKPRISNMAMLTPDEGMKIVLQYFGIKGNDAGATPVRDNEKKDFDVKLEDLL